MSEGVQVLLASWDVEVENRAAELINLVREHATKAPQNASGQGGLGGRPGCLRGGRQQPETGPLASTSAADERLGQPDRSRRGLVHRRAADRLASLRERSGIDHATEPCVRRFGLRAERLI